MSVTLPRQLFQRDAVTVFLEAPGSDSPDFPRLFMKTGDDKVAITDGAALRVTARVHERVAFDLLTETGERLCTWLPPVRISANSPPELADGFRHFAIEQFRNAGDPLTLNIGGKLVTGAGRYRIDGLDAAILARNSWEVILRDPCPAAGMRTVESQGYSITLPFVQVELRLSKPSQGRGTLSISVLGFDLVKRKPDDFPELLLANLSEQTIGVLCGKSISRGHDEYNGRVISLLRDRTGAFTTTCKVKFRREGRISITAMVLEIHSGFPNPFRLPQISK